MKHLFTCFFIFFSLLIYAQNERKIAVVTLCIGHEYSEKVKPGEISKQMYCKRHGYDLYYGGKEFYDKSRPIPWSKIPYILSVLPNYDYVFFSDADVVIMNMNIKLEDIIDSYLPGEKDFLIAIDGVGNINSGNFFIRNTLRAKNLLTKVYSLKEFIHHPWWENMAIIELINKDLEMKAATEVTPLHRLFNSYPQQICTDPYQKGTSLYILLVSGILVS